MNHFVGIDWADQKHDICVIDDKGQIIREFIIGDHNGGYLNLHVYLQSLTTPRIILERPTGLLVDYLMDVGYPVYFVPPTISVTHRPRKSKSDRGDAYMLANLLWRNDDECRLVVRSTDLCQQIRQVVVAHDKMQRESQRLGAQLRNHLKNYYPAILKMFSTPNQPLTYAFLEAFPDPHEAAQASLEELQGFFSGQKYRYSQRIESHLETLQRDTPTRLNTHGDQLGTAALVAVLKTTDEQIRILRREMHRLFRQHPNYNWIKSLPGVGDLNGARLLARLGDNRDPFEDVDMLRATAGTVPITRSSGKRRSVHFRQACSRPLRKIFYDLAMKSKAKSAWAKDYFEAQLARGHAPARANRALANRWVGIVWKLWETGEMYNEAKHQANREQADAILRAS